MAKKSIKVIDHADLKADEPVKVKEPTKSKIVINTPDDTVEIDETKPVGELQETFEEKVETQEPNDSEDPEQSEETEDISISEEFTSDNDSEDQTDEIAEEFVKPETFADRDIEEAVDDIVSKESDVVLKSEDEKKQVDADKPQKTKKSFRKKLGWLFHKWWDNPVSRYVGLAIVVIGILASVLVPASRYAVLNMAGVRVKASLSVVDANSSRPISNVTVALGDKTARTDEEGFAQFDGLKLGKNKLVVDKRGFAKEEKDMVLGWGSNPLGDQGLTVVGSQYTFNVKDWLSNNPVIEAKAGVSGVDADADTEGKIVVTVPLDVPETETITIRSEGYRDESFVIADLSDAEQEIKLVPSKKHVFVSKRAGKYDVYKIDVDGKNEELLVKATGKERDTISLIPHDSDNVVALVSTRDNDRNKDGYILDGIFVVNILSGDITKVARSEQIRIIGWEGERLIFSQVVEGTSAGNPNRSKIISYQYKDTTRRELASANYFNAIELFSHKVYYAVSSYAVPESSAKFFRVAPEGGDAQKILDKEVWSIFQSAPDELYLNASGSEWYELKGNSNSAVKLSEQPNYQDSKIFVPAPGESTHLWIDYRDGKGVLLLDEGKDEDRVLLTASGISYPAYWVTPKHIIYRVQDGRETADYIINIEGGDPKKIVDVTSVVGSRDYF